MVILDLICPKKGLSKKTNVICSHKLDSYKTDPEEIHENLL